MFRILSIFFLEKKFSKIDTMQQYMYNMSMLYFY